MAEALRRGEMIEHTISPQCITCTKTQTPGKKLLQCSRCKVTRYCDQKCATDWKGGITVNGEVHMSHRDVCNVLKTMNLKLPEMQAIAKQFPWARQQTDGTFMFDILLASKGLLGTGCELGWWTQPPCCVDDSRYVRGFLLLEDEHLRDYVGWKLPSKEIPWLDFLIERSTLPPKFSPPLEHSWSKYYEWRGLPLESPVVLLLHWPLSIYRLLHLLGLASAYTLGRRHLTVHLLRVDTELDLLPVFGELALLLPNTDLDLVLFGPGVVKLLEKAKENQSCLASRPFVYMYKAPEASGSGTIRIELSRSGPYYDGTNLRVLRNEKPDAMIALNAGLSAYQEWRSLVLASRALAIPFAVTDYNEISCYGDIRYLLRLFSITHKLWWPTVNLTTAEQQRLTEMSDVSYPIELNPFMHPGPRAKAVYVGPNSSNGYTLVVTPGGIV